MNMLRLGIKGRVYSGFGVLVALSLALALFGGWQLSSLSTKAGELALIAEYGSYNQQVGRHLEVMQRSVLAFRLNGEDEALKAGDEAASRAVKLLQELSRVALSQERRRIYDGIAADIASFQSVRENLVAVVHHLRGERDKLFRLGEDLTAATDKLIQTARRDDDRPANRQLAAVVETAVLLVRVANWRFLVTQDPNGAATFKTNLERAAATIAALEKAELPDSVRILIAPVKSALPSYRAAFDSVAADMLKSAEMYSKQLAPQLVKMKEARAATEASLDHTLQQTKSDSANLVSGAMTLQRTIAALALLLGGVIAYVVGRGIVRPIAGVTGAMRRLAEGDLAAEVPGREREDEIGQIGRAVEAFKVRAIEKAKHEVEQHEAEANAVAAERKAEMHRLADTFEGAVGAIVESISTSATQLETAASTLTHTADTTQQLSAVVASASEQASANVKSVAASTDEMASSVNEIGRQVQESSTIAHEAVSQAQKTDARIGELSHAASRIGDVVKLITAIAEQTNLLALNAPIEAARAGEAGRGFAVVAQEVKALAAQTAKATDEIGGQIAAMQNATRDSVTAIKEIGATIDRVAGIASTIAAAVEEQGAATQEIARNVQQTAQGTSQVAANIADVNRGASETGSASAQVLTSARSLAGEGAKLKREVDRFLATVRAA